MTPFLFNGRFGVMSDPNGLYFMRARFYSPDIKRFVNQDVLLGEVGEGQSLNRYAFVTGRPVTLWRRLAWKKLREIVRSVPMIASFTVLTIPNLRS